MSSLSSGFALGRVRDEDGALRLAELRVILDTTDSEVFGTGTRPMPA